MTVKPEELKTALVEATHYERPRMSEMVPPSIHSRLKRLGVWRQAAYLAQEVLLEPLA